MNSNNGTCYVSVPANGKDCPLLVYLHGQGANEDQGRSMFESYTTPENIALVSPKGESPSSSWTMAQGSRVNALVEEVCSKYSQISKDKVFLVGYSAGGTIAYSYGTAGSQLYKAMAIVNSYMAPNSVSLGGKLPVYLIECEGDPNKPAAEQAKAQLKSAGFDVTYDIIPSSSGGSSHGYPTTVASPMIVKWIKDQCKASSSSSADEETNSSDSSNGEAHSSEFSENSQQTAVNSDSTFDENTSSTNPNSEEQSSNGDSTKDDESSSKNNQTDDGTDTDKSTSSTSEKDSPPPVVNSFGIPVGGLTDSEVESLVKEWLNTVYKPSQSPPDNTGGWVLNDWGIWTNGLITHNGKIDGYGSITDFWLKTSTDCFHFAENRGSTLHEGMDTLEDSDGNSMESVTATRPGSDNTSTETEEPAQDNDSSENGHTADNSNDSDTEGVSSSTGNEGVISGEPEQENNGSSSEFVPALTENDSSDNTPQNVMGRAVTFYLPSGFNDAESEDWSLVVFLSGIAGNTDYLKLKLSAGCDSAKCVFAGIKAINDSDNPFGYRWENDASENIEFIREVVNTIESKYNLNQSKTIIGGFSNGAHFIGQQGSRLTDIFEGFILCEGGSFISSDNKQILISGSKPVESFIDGNRWSAFCEGMGHKLPGRSLPIFQDPGIEKDSAGNTINGKTMFQWLRNE